jgi:hypothetical protein
MRRGIYAVSPVASKFCLAFKLVIGDVFGFQSARGTDAHRFGINNVDFV